MQNRETWSSRVGFILAAVGSAIGLGNIWRFPYMAYENGGGAFLIPYFCAMLAAGIPFMILEFGLGHKYRGSAPRIFATISKKMEWLGWWQVFIAFVITCYYVVVVAWSISYTGLSLTQGWGDDPGGYFFTEFLQVSKGPFDIGGIVWHILAASVLAWGIAYAAVFTGIRSGIERANKIFMPLLFILVLVFISRTVTLPGALDGLNWLFKPDFSKIMHMSVWASAFGQIFYTLSIAFAIMLAYSSYLPKKSDINNNAFMTVFINCGFSMLGGLMVFSVLGYMAGQQGVALDKVVNGGVGLAFVTLPTAINLMPFPQLFGILFFLALTVAGISSLISIIEAVTSSIMDKLGMSRRKTASLVCATGFLVSLVFSCNGGIFVLDIVDHYINNFGILSAAFIEVIFIGWFCNLKELRLHINKISEFAVGGIWTVCILVVAPAMLGYIYVMNFIDAIKVPYEKYDWSALNTYGWGMIITGVVIALIIPLAKKSFGSSAMATDLAGGN